jgi:hypothetical protein
MRIPALVAMLTLFAAPSAFAFTIYNSDQSARGARYGDPGGQAHAVGAGERGKNAGAPRNHVSIYSGVMPGTHEVLPPPASLFNIPKPKTAKATPAAR